MMQKKIASSVKSDHTNWHKIKYGVMEKVLRGKIECSDEFRSELLSTDDKLLIEARGGPLVGAWPLLQNDHYHKPQVSPWAFLAR